MANDAATYGWDLNGMPLLLAGGEVAGISLRPVLERVQGGGLDIAQTLTELSADGQIGMGSVAMRGDDEQAEIGKLAQAAAILVMVACLQCLVGLGGERLRGMVRERSFGGELHEEGVEGMRVRRAFGGYHPEGWVQIVPGKEI